MGKKVIQIENGDTFKLQTKNTTYAFTIKNAIPIHLYYGEKLEGNVELKYITPSISRSFAPYNADFGDTFSLDNIELECSIDNEGDFRTPTISLKNHLGQYIYNFKYSGYEIKKGKVNIPPFTFYIRN